LEGIAQNFAAGTVHCTVQTGSAAQRIINSAGADKRTLIALATHGRSGLDRWLLGSVAEKVLRGGSNPTLVVRARDAKNPSGAMATLKRMIVPLDGSELSEGILPYIKELAKQLGGNAVDADPCCQHQEKSADKDPTAAEGRDAVGDMLTERDTPFEGAVYILRQVFLLSQTVDDLLF
jgi:hypothetical protein